MEGNFGLSKAEITRSVNRKEGEGAKQIVSLNQMLVGSASFTLVYGLANGADKRLVERDYQTEGFSKMGVEKDSGSAGDTIKVYIRIRPMDSYDTSSSHHKAMDVDDSGKSIIVYSKPEQKIYTYDSVIRENATQAEIFTLVGKQVIENCVMGYNGTIFAYGQTGSGKTYTMLGPSEDSEDFQHELRGIVPRTFENLFHLLEKQQTLHGKGTEFLVKCSFLEIYKEQVFDLLEPSTVTLHLRECMKKGIYVDGLTEVTVTSPSEAYQTLNSGWINRRVASTSMNRESSRSHAVFSLIIESKESKSGLQNMKTSHLNLVDLAGSEKQKDTNAVGLRLKEASSINTSLSNLGNVIMALVNVAHGKSNFVPYRNSKLTFLLRDSLGGNAKTHLIACVHPGLRNFAETYSTLQFARRAKLIKNKAKVNEDTQGNVLLLQAEIRRLKETLKQYQAGSVPTQPSSNNDNVMAPAVDDSEWKDKFFYAMLFWEKSETDKKLQQEQILRVEDLCNKKDKYIQSSKMILKFRESTIAKLEKSKKMSPVNDDDRVNDLKAEIKCLNSMLEQNPVVTKYSMEIQRLKAEIEELSRKAVTQEQKLKDSNKIKDLENCYKELLLKQQTGTDVEISSALTPSHTPQSGDSIATASIEKYKSQVSNLQSELDTLKQSLTEQKDTAEKKQMELESEVASHKQAVKDLTAVLEAHKLKSKLERDVHLQTVKTITTPKKAYHLRNRVVKCMSDSVFPDEEVGIMQETEPESMAEEAQEALLEEIKQLQQSNNSFSQRLEEYESDGIRLKQHISKIDHQNAQLQAIIDRERTERGIQEEQLRVLEDQKQATENEKQLLESEIRDLKILLNSSDKELKEYRNSHKDTEDEFKKNVGFLETKLMQISLEFSKQTKEYEAVCEERDRLKETTDTLEETNNFFENMVKETEESLQQQDKKIQDFSRDLQNANHQIEVEKQKNCELLSQIDTEGAVKEQKILELINERDCLQTELTFEKNKNEEQMTTIAGLKSKEEAINNRVASLMKKQEENQEAVAAYMVKTQELREQLSSAKAEHEDVVHQCTTLRHNIQDLEVDVRNKNITIDELQRQRAQQAEAYDVETSKMQVEVECLTEDNCKIIEDLAATEDQLKTSQVHAENLMKEIEILKKEMDDKESQYNRMLSEKEELLRDAEKRSSTEELHLYNEEIIRLQTSNNCLQHIIEDYEKRREEKDHENQCLKEKLAESIKYEEELNRLKLEYRTLESEKENDRISLEESVADLKQKMNQLDTMKEELRSTENSLETATATNLQLESQMSELIKLRETDEETKKTLQEEADRLKNLAVEYIEKNEEFEHKNIKMEEELTKSQKELEQLNLKLDKLMEENALLSGHQNHKQKIHYTVTVKEENNFLREKLQKLNKELLDLKLQKGANKPHHDSAMKENVHPDINCHH